MPSEKSIGFSTSPRASLIFGLSLGDQLHSFGINLDLAPVVDLDPQNPDSVITKFDRSLGTDPTFVSGSAVSIVRGMRQRGVIAAAKHFPSESWEDNNPHDGVATSQISLEQLQERDLIPYQKLTNDGLNAVLISHVIFPKIDPNFPASLSPKIIQNILRKEIGFKGLVICDDLQMGAIRNKYSLEEASVKALQAGVDLLIATGDTGTSITNALIKAAQTGELSTKDAQQTLDRIDRIKKKYKIGVSLN